MTQGHQEIVDENETSINTSSIQRPAKQNGNLYWHFPGDFSDLAIAANGDVICFARASTPGIFPSAVCLSQDGVRLWSSWAHNQPIIGLSNIIYVGPANH
jgi:hypothetical protein